jgi:hypothetical protein
MRHAGCEALVLSPAAVPPQRSPQIPKTLRSISRPLRRCPRRARRRRAMLIQGNQLLAESASTAPRPRGHSTSLPRMITPFWAIFACGEVSDCQGSFERSSQAPVEKYRLYCSLESPAPKYSVSRTPGSRHESPPRFCFSVDMKPIVVNATTLRGFIFTEIAFINVDPTSR